MGVTKAEAFKKSHNQSAALFKALAHPARIAIVHHLQKVNACVCGDLVNLLPLSQATVSQHLKELKQAGILKGTVEGNAVCYCLCEKTMARFRKMAALLLQTPGTAATDCC